jgi:hypothetical protein
MAISMRFLIFFFKVCLKVNKRGESGALMNGLGRPSPPLKPQTVLEIEKEKTMAILEEIKKSPVVRAYRQGWLAWLGAHKTAFDLAQDGAEKFKSNREQFIQELVEKGQEIEVQAQDGVAKAKDFVEPRINDAREKIATARGKLFTRGTTEATDRFEELSGEIAKLGKTVSALGRKVNSVRKPAAPKAAAPKAAVKKTAAKPAEKTTDKAAA